MKVCIYTRCSTSEDRQDVARQIHELTTIANNFGWEITKIYQDYASGSKSSRPALDQMMKDAHARPFEMVIISSLCRLGRSLSNMTKLLTQLKEYKIDLYTKQEGINTNSSMGEMFFGIISSINQYQLSQISENVKSGLRLAKKKGRLVGRQSVLDKGKIWEIEKLKDKGFSYRKIAKKMNVSHSTIMRCVNKKHILNKEVSVDG